MKKFAMLLSVVFLLILFTSVNAQAATLYAVTGDGGTPSETLYTLDQTDASSTFVMTLGAGDDGETIGFNPDDGFLYHSSGISDGDRAWESIDVSVPSIVTSTQFTGPAVDGENLAMTWNPATGTFLVTDLVNEFFSATTAGAATDIGDVDEYLKGLAFVGGTLYGAAVSSDLLYDLNPLTGVTNSAVSITLAGFTVEGATGLATNPDDGVLWGLLKTDGGGPGFRDLVTINPLTGVATLIGATDRKGFAGIAFVPDADVNPVPEPATIALLGIGIVGLAGGAARRKWKKKSVDKS